MTLKVSREQQGEVEHTRELLTIRQMREKGFSANLVFPNPYKQFSIFGMLPTPPNTKSLKIDMFFSRT